MKPKAILGWVTLAVNLYALSKDEELMKSLSETAKKSKQKINDLFEDLTGGEEETEAGILEKLLHRAKQVRKEVEQKIEETAENVYRKMHIAHTGEIGKLEAEIDRLKKELALTEARVMNLSQKIPQ